MTRLAVAALAVVALAGATGMAGASHRPVVEVVATNLDNPRKLFVAADGAVYVVEAGTGGRDRCAGTGAARYCVGLSGAIAKVSGSGKRRVVTGLFSAARPDRSQAAGPADVVVRGPTFDVLVQNTSIDARGHNHLGRDGATAGDLVSTAAGKAAPEVLVNFAAFEAAHDPDRGAGPGPKLGNPAIDSDPYAFVSYRGGYAVVDAAANDLLLVRDGRVSVLAVFPTQAEPLTPAVARQIGARPAMRTISAQSVPSSVAVGPDGALYVGELTGVPFTPGTARVWRVVAGRKPTVFASGFTNIADLAFDGRDLLVLELAARGLRDAASPGALIRLGPGGKRTVLVRSPLHRPTGIAVASGWIYVSNNGLSPGSGPGRHGQLVRIRA